MYSGLRSNVLLNFHCEKYFEYLTHCRESSLTIPLFFFADMYYYLVGLALLGSCLANGPQDSFQSRSAEYAPVKYGGPIVYSGEKPPIIHFPPPPRDVSKN